MPGGLRTTIVTAVAALLAAVPLLALMESPGWATAVPAAVELVAAAGWTLRRSRVPAPLVVAVQVVVLGWWLGVLASNADRGGSPWRALLPDPARLAATVRDGIDVIRENAAPLPPDPGAVVLLVACAGVVAIAADLVVAGRRRPVLAGPVLATGYLIAAGVLPGGVAWFWFVPPAAGYLVLLATEGRDRVVRWGRFVGPGADPGDRPGRTGLRTGRRAGLVAVSAAVVVPALLPGLGDGVVDESLFARLDDGVARAPAVLVDNPIVDLHRNLTRPQDLPVLQYTTDAPEPPYLRVAVHDEFDGSRWHQGEGTTLQPLRGDLPAPPGAGAEPPVADIEITVTENYPWRSLPLPYPPLRVVVAGEWFYDPDTLEVGSPDGDPRGLTFSADVALVPADAERLRSAPPPGPELDPLLALPADAAVVDPYLEEAVGAAETDYDRARALEAWFRGGGGFVYDTDTVDPGTATGSLLTFLQDRRGYCEQYAATMAVMARRLGIPARVAVGFLPGDPSPGGGRIVTTHDAHAWPELWFEGTGWVAFEPTPARPGAAPGPGTQPPAETPSPETPPAETPSAEPSTDSVATAAVDEPDDVAAGAAGGDGPGALGGLVAAAVLVLLTGRPAGTAFRRRRRWRRAAGRPRREAEAAWTELRLAVRDAGLGPVQDTPRATTARLTRAVTLDDAARAALHRLATAVERARYARSAAPVATLRQDVRAVRRALLRTRPLRRRVRVALWPALWPARTSPPSAPAAVTPLVRALPR
ncbi:transglutaminaseTgpA domain-containing protein [Jiangella alba]|uniref:Transglutaminase-like enzyme, putative cysteine protease n=1 Tax=Jiangella alba TaxID=561176 RepID=A0A1H5KGP8_9ACTN|nr:DUF3488 and transglutaminase-like domain-containing protein [Jiangella alba]SEE63597.1 Transglutaminase-like enzyme, putative cysteine protease [Jiangella alba]